MGATEINISQEVELTLNPDGRLVYYEYFAKLGVLPYPHIRQDGTIRLALWEAMHIFGPHLIMGMNPPIKTTIKVFSEDGIAGGIPTKPTDLQEDEKIVVASPGLCWIGDKPEGMTQPEFEMMLIDLSAAINNGTLKVEDEGE